MGDTNLTTTPRTLCALSALLVASLGVCSAWGADDVGAGGWQTQKENPTCESLHANLHKHVAVMSSLTQSMAKAATAPPDNIKAMILTWLGQPHTSAAQIKLRKRLDKERDMAAELNRMAGSVGCAPVNVDAELQRMTAEKTTKPSQP